MLHIHSYYSMLRGTASLDRLIAKAKEYNVPALSLTDTNGAYGAIQFYKKAKEAGIKPIIGALIDDPANPALSAIFLARNREGYTHLCEIITARKLDETFSLPALLRDPVPDCFILTPSIELLRSVPNRPNLYAELSPTPTNKRAVRLLYNFASERGIKVAASHPVFFIEPEEFSLHRLLTAIRLRKTIDSLDPESLVDEDYFFKDPRDTEILWRGLPEALANAAFITENANLELSLGKPIFPRFPAPGNESSYSLLWQLSFDGAQKRYSGIDDTVTARLRYELSVIAELGYTDYFLVVYDIVREAKQRGMMIIGRGSAGNSLVAYCLGFTDVDPIRYNLYFERFLNKSRTTPPDVDLDFSWRERDDIVRYVFEKYGYDRVAMISTTVTFRARSAFRETAKAHGLPDSEISQYSKFIPWTSAANLPNLPDLFPEAKSLPFKQEPWKTIVESAARITGFPRHLSIHPGGIVIAPHSITRYVPLEFAKNKGLGLIITQPDMYPIEDIGLIKIDLLSQRSLGVLRDTIRLISEPQPMNS